MKAIDPPNLEPPYDSLYDDLEVWKVTIIWDGDEWEIRYIPYIGYDSYEMLDSFKREFHKEVMRYVGYASPSREQAFVYTVLKKEEALEDCWNEGYMDTFALLFDIPSYPCEEPYKTRYYKKDIVDWLMNNTERWCKIEVMNFWDIPEEKQKEIRSFMEEERAIQDHINRGGEL